MEEMTKSGRKGYAAMKAGMDRKTARKYLREGQLPSESCVPRTWRTRDDPFETDWPALEARLKDAPELEAKVLFEDLMERHPGRYQPGQLRTLQRRIRRWRAQQGPDKRVFLAQAHRPGEAMQTDFTHGTELGVTIAGAPFPHLLCHPVLPYSNWEWVTVCRSESMAALRGGVQAAIFRLGRSPEFHQTDNSSAATHDLGDRKRAFNRDYESLVEHLGMKPRKTGVGEKEQNGDVEALNGALKRRVRQRLLLRGNADFESVEVYERWLQDIVDRANLTRNDRVREELNAMRPVAVSRLPEYSEIRVRVNSRGTISVRRNIYSVPSRLRDEEVRARIYDDRIEVWYAGELQLSTERLKGEGRHRVDYRHVIWSLVRHPGGFARYRYRDDLFPSSIFRDAFDALQSDRPGRPADIEYLRILHLSASTFESTVEAACNRLLAEGHVPLADRVKALVAPVQAEVPEMPPMAVDLATYDVLLAEPTIACEEVS